jgi:carbamoyl-phosphate synthase large subunit
MRVWLFYHESGQIALMINTLSSDKRIEREAARIRRAAVEAGMPCLTSLDTAKALLMSLAAKREAQTYALATIDEHLAGSAK